MLQKVADGHNREFEPKPNQMENRNDHHSGINSPLDLNYGGTYKAGIREINLL